MNVERKPLLRDAIRKGLQAARVRLVHAARDLNVPVTTLQGWLDRNRFRREELTTLLKLSGLKTDDIQADDPIWLEELQKEFSFRLVRGGAISNRTGVNVSEIRAEPLSQVVRKMELQSSRLVEAGHFVLEVQRFFGAMRSGDCFYYVSHNKLPYEWEAIQSNPDLRRTVYRAGVEQDCRFSYFFSVFSSEDPEWCDANPDYIEASFERFKKAIMEERGAGSDLSAEEVGELVEKNFKRYPIARDDRLRGPFFLPESKLALFSFDELLPSGEVAPQFGGFIYFPWQATSGIHVAMSEALTQSISRWIHRYLSDSGKEKAGEKDAQP